MALQPPADPARTARALRACLRCLPPACGRGLEEGLLAAARAALPPTAFERLPAHVLLREGKCFEAISIFTHHLAEGARGAALVAGLELPLLPEPRPVRRVARGNSGRELSGQDGPHSTAIHGWWSEFQPQHQAAHLAEQLEKQQQALVEDGTWDTILQVYLHSSPCTLAHMPVAPPPEIDASQTFATVGFDKSEPVDETAVAGAGYVSCDEQDVCAGADVNYYLQASVRTYQVPNSRRILNPSRGKLAEEAARAAGADDAAAKAAGAAAMAYQQPAGGGGTTQYDISKVDLNWTTRTLEAIPGAPNSPFGADNAGGDGTLGVLGPSLRVAPGQTMSLFLKARTACGDRTLWPPFRTL